MIPLRNDRAIALRRTQRPAPFELLLTFLAFLFVGAIVLGAV